VTIDEKLEALADLEAIRDLARHYAHCVWTRNADAAAELFAEDGIMDTGDREPLVGRAEIQKTYRETFAASDFRPFVHQHIVDLSGDQATGTCYLTLKAIVDRVAMTGYGYYDDEYIRVPEGWRFRRRRLNLVHYDEDFVAPPP
jgi:ketosteroid isomerase-like protein